jgi:hypothetical protein
VGLNFQAFAFSHWLKGDVVGEAFYNQDTHKATIIALKGALKKE